MPHTCFIALRGRQQRRAACKSDEISPSSCTRGARERARALKALHQRGDSPFFTTNNLTRLRLFANKQKSLGDTPPEIKFIMREQKRASARIVSVLFIPQQVLSLCLFIKKKKHAHRTPCVTSNLKNPHLNQRIRLCRWNILLPGRIFVPYGSFNFIPFHISLHVGFWLELYFRPLKIKCVAAQTNKL